MDTERLILLNGELDNQLYCELSEDELCISRHFVEITRHLQEIHHLFLILNYNIDQLKNNYVLMANGNLLRGEKKAENEEDYIAVNALVTNLIGSGRSLVESMEVYIKNSVIDPAQKENFTNFERNLYDHSFAYRLLIRLRDFSQPGHLSVSKSGNNYYFDLNQIVEKPHFNHNKKLEDEMKRIRDEIIDTYRNTPTFSLTLTVAEYVSKLFSLYNEFWKVAESEFETAYIKFREVINKNPENIVSDGNPFSRFFLYDMVDGNAHVVSVDDESLLMFETFQKEAEQLSQKYHGAYRQLADGTLWVRCSVDKQSIEIGRGLEVLGE